ncbi:MAG: hypothetical protein JSV60_07705 [Desulfobacterales bacterium]|nr:MAG: hypothetical protein JSV60_07705 [Desulfobacterales bacterium]
MFPFAFEWAYDPVHFVFMGSVYTVLIALVIILHYCGIRAFLDLICKKKDHNH